MEMLPDGWTKINDWTYAYAAEKGWSVWYSGGWWHAAAGGTTLRGDGGRVRRWRKGEEALAEVEKRRVAWFKIIANAKARKAARDKA